MSASQERFFQIHLATETVIIDFTLSANIDAGVAKIQNMYEAACFEMVIGYSYSALRVERIGS
jgi:hypothetical protein